MKKLFAIVAVMGLMTFGLTQSVMAQEEVVVKRIMEKHPQVDFIFGTHNLHRLPQLLKEAMFSKEMVVEVWSKEGDVIEKTFDGIPADAEGYLIINPCLFNRVMFEVNGRKLYWTNSRTKSLNIPCKLNNGKISLRLLRIDANLPAMLFDSQRDYQRSLLNGQKIDGEWLMRFYY